MIPRIQSNFFLIPPMYNANRGFGFWYIEIVLVPLILMHRYFSEKKGLWPLQRNVLTSIEHTNLDSNVREMEEEVEDTYNDWTDEIQALYAETRQVKNVISQRKTMHWALKAQL